MRKLEKIDRGRIGGDVKVTEREWISEVRCHNVLTANSFEATWQPILNRPFRTSTQLEKSEASERQEVRMNDLYQLSLQGTAIIFLNGFRFNFFNVTVFNNKLHSLLFK